MPIRFRCAYCNRLLGIATRKAGTETKCPHCGAAVTVPSPNDEPTKTERLNLDDVDQLLGHATERVTEPATQVLEAPPVEAPVDLPKRSTSKPTPRQPVSKSPATKPALKEAVPPDDRPLFENDLDQIFGPTDPPREVDRPQVPPVSGEDARSLEAAPRVFVITPQKATLMLCSVVILLALAFAAGYLAAR